MTDTTQPEARFVRGRAMLAQPFPEALAAELPTAEVERHAEIGKKLAEASRERARLRAAVADAAGADAHKAAEAAAKGKPVPKATEPGLREQLAEADRVAAALEAGLLVSANNLLRLAQPLAGPVADRLERELEASTDDVRDGIAALRVRLLEVAEAYAAAAWVRALTRAQGTTVAPFTVGRSTAAFEKTAGELRVVGEALEYELDLLADRRRQAAAWEAEQAAFTEGEQAKRAERESA